LKCFDEGKKAVNRRRREGNKRRSARWLSKNAEKNREYQRIWAAKNRAKNPDRCRSNQNAWSAANRDKKAEHLKKWRIANRDKVIHTNRARRARKKMALVPESALVTKDWFDQLCSSVDRCAYCLDASKKLTADHIVPFVRGGKHVRENIAPSCKSCNSKKRSRLISEWRPWIDIPLYGLDLASA
jgi:5-methylcytosine-specific restriction endonuclease McrA